MFYGCAQHVLLCIVQSLFHFLQTSSFMKIYIFIKETFVKLYIPLGLFQKVGEGDRKRLHLICMNVVISKCLNSCNLTKLCFN